MSFSRDEFLGQRAPRRGRTNPERMRVPLWEWLVTNPISAYEANAKFGTPGQWYTEPGWCFQRFGCSRTELPDGRVLHIAGEHEDSYDPDFYIYNDVIVEHPDGQVEIFGYPEDVFPPTDGHSATLVGDGIYLIGNIGYPAQRRIGVTPVLRLDLGTLAIEPVATSGEAPGWISDHGAWLDTGGTRIITRRGVAEVDSGQGRVDLVDDWALDLSTGVWVRLTRRPVAHWRVARADGAPLMLFELGNAAFEKRYPSAASLDPASPEAAALIEALEAIGPPDLGDRVVDYDLLEALYVPAVAHERTHGLGEDATDLPDDGSGQNMRNDMCRLRVAEARVRYVVEDDQISVRIEGELEGGTTRALLEDLRGKLAVLQQAPCVIEPERTGPAESG